MLQRVLGPAVYLTRRSSNLTSALSLWHWSRRRAFGMGPFFSSVLPGPWDTLSPARLARDGSGETPAGQCPGGVSSRIASVVHGVHGIETPVLLRYRLPAPTEGLGNARPTETLFTSQSHKVLLLQREPPAEFADSSESLDRVSRRTLYGTDCRLRFHAVRVRRNLSNHEDRSLYLGWQRRSDRRQPPGCLRALASAAGDCTHIRPGQYGGPSPARKSRTVVV
jgi:hypothetical protein